MRWSLGFTIFLKRWFETQRNVDPMITCSPWNPVAIKNLLPNAESWIEKGASVYSNPWKSVKIIPRKIVVDRDVFAVLYLFFIMLWWDQVTVTPEDRRMMVFRRGILMGLNGLMERGGQFCPSSIVGEILV